MERTVKLRPYQESVICRALDALDNGEGVIINSPTGTGKTLMGLEIGRRYSEEHGFKYFDVFVRTRSQYTPWEENARKILVHLCLWSLTSSASSFETPQISHTS